MLKKQPEAAKKTHLCKERAWQLEQFVMRRYQEFASMDFHTLKNDLDDYRHPLRVSAQRVEAALLDFAELLQWSATDMDGVLVAQQTARATVRKRHDEHFESP